MSLAIINGDIFERKEDSIYISGNRIMKIGNIDSMIDENTTVIDAEEKTVIPGFFDAHTHFASMGLTMESDVSACRSIHEILTIIEQKNLNTVHGWDETVFKENRYLLKKDLDAIDFPVIAIRVCGHLAVLNSAAIEKLDLNKLDPKFYDLEMGIFKEDNLSTITKMYPKTVDDYVHGIHNATERAYALGVTSVVDTVNPSIFRAYERMETNGSLGVRAHLYIKAKYIDHVTGAGLSRIGSEKLRFNGIKIFTDGSLGAKTAALSFPYRNSEENGALIYDTESLTKLIHRAEENELQAMIHCIGDRAVHQVLDCLERIPRKVRHKLEHVEITDKEIRQRMNNLGVPCSVQPNFLKWSKNMYVERLGDNAVLNNRYKKMMEEGLTMGFGSDCMPFSPLFGIRWAVNDPYGECITVEEAIRFYTHGSAYLAYRENDLGSIEEGKLADLVILSGGIDSEDVEKIDVERTIFDGKTVL
jgi:hypothetical protein